MSSLATVDRNLHHRVERVYDDLLELGAHPNQLGIFANLQIKETPEAMTISTLYLVGDSDQLRLALRRCAQVGLATFEIIRQVFKERCEILQLTPQLARVSKGL